MRNLVRRYVTQEQRKAENEGVTEDDVNEIKNDISAFRFELIEIMRASGMKTQGASGPSGPGGKKNRQKERRLMKGTGFHLSTGAPSTAGASPSSVPANSINIDKRSSMDVTIDMSVTRRTANKGFHRIAKLVGSGSGGGQMGASATLTTAPSEDKTSIEEFGVEADACRKWGKLSIAEAIKTAKVPRLIRGHKRNPSEESHLSMSVPTKGSSTEEADPTLSRTSTKRDKYLKVRSPVCAGAPGPGNAGEGGDSYSGGAGVSDAGELISNKSFGTEPNRRTNSSRLQRTNRIDEDSDSSAPSSDKLKQFSRPGPPASVKTDNFSDPMIAKKSINGQNELLKKSDLWGRLEVKKGDGALEPLLTSSEPAASEPLTNTIPRQNSYHASVPGLQPMSNNRCSMQTSGWL